MKDSDVKVGMKVVPHRKTAAGWGGLSDCGEWQRAKNDGQSYLFVRSFCDNQNASLNDGSLVNAWVLSATGENDLGGDFFNASDFEPYVESQPAPGYVVAADLPTRISCRHDSYAEAETEAKRLCLKEGKPFRVLKIVAVVEPAQPTVKWIGE